MGLGRYGIYNYVRKTWDTPPENFQKTRKTWGKQKHLRKTSRTCGKIAIERLIPLKQLRELEYLGKNQDLTAMWGTWPVGLE